MNVIYQIHEFCVNNFHYHNAVDDYRYSHYQTLAACVVAGAFAVRNLVAEDLGQTGDDYNAMILSHLSYSGDGNVDETVAAD